jgi:hypothetical protein
LLRANDAITKFDPINDRRRLGQRRAGLYASLKCVFVRVSAGKMERDPGTRRGSNEKVGVSDIETCVSHPCNEAKLPGARSVATTGQNHGTSRITQLIISMQKEYLSEAIREPARSQDFENADAPDCSANSQDRTLKIAGYWPTFHY